MWLVSTYKFSRGWKSWSSHLLSYPSFLNFRVFSFSFVVSYSTSGLCKPVSRLLKIPYSNFSFPFFAEIPPFHSNVFWGRGTPVKNCEWVPAAARSNNLRQDSITRNNSRFCFAWETSLTCVLWSRVLRGGAVDPTQNPPPLSGLGTG